MNQSLLEWTIECQKENDATNEFRENMNHAVELENERIEEDKQNPSKFVQINYNGTNICISRKHIVTFKLYSLIKEEYILEIYLTNGIRKEFKMEDLQQLIDWAKLINPKFQFHENLEDV